MLQKIAAYVEISKLSDFRNDPKLEPGTEYSIVIDYPLYVPLKYRFKAKEGGGLGNLLKHISKAYQKAYANDSNIWGHDIDDLTLCGIKINNKTREISLQISS